MTDLREQSIAALTTICVLIGVLVVIQLWLLGASLQAALGGDVTTPRSAAVASIVLLCANGGLLLLLGKLRRR
jgi:hypothetical protein